MDTNSSAANALKQIISAETIADKILVNKQEIISLDKRRHESLEALRKMRDCKEGNVWVTIGTILVKANREIGIKLLESDMTMIEGEIQKLRSEQKLLINEHRDVEFQSPYIGSRLVPLSSLEIRALRSNFPL